MDPLPPGPESQPQWGLVPRSRLNLKNHIIRTVPTRILFSDEAHFWLNSYVNKQNCRIWSEANLQVYVETLHPEKLTVWYALWAGGIIGPYFFKNDEGHNVTVNAPKNLVYVTPLGSDGDLVARISEDAACMREIPGMFKRVSQSLR
ncbi:DUF4817 domain-containing protein [Trichonephila clavipes]|nr:DUF4817 domain-containing protein [Trichonephila clavipes]